MAGTGLWLRVFAGLVIAVIGPILLLVAAMAFAESVIRAANPATVAVAVVAGAIAWAAVLAVVYTRILADDLRALRTLAERGERGEPSERGHAYRQVAGALDERERQVVTLAAGTGTVPIDETPVRVVGAVVQLVRSVMSDPTWTCAILSSARPELLPPGRYDGPEDGPGPRPLDDLARWASVNLAQSEAPAARLEGPWGAFVATSVRVSERLGGILVAPWEGRAAPTPAELALITLVGHHAATALDHSILYATVRTQADDLNRLAAVQADFLRGVTHDLQTPLTSIGALATELRASEEVPPSAGADLDTIAHQADRLRRMVGQLLVASRIEAGVFTPRTDVFAVRPLVERTWAALRAERPFALDESGTAHLAVGDPDRLEQVLWALLDNAVKYSPDGSPIEVAIAADAGQLAVTVRDRGTGMDEEARSRAFDQFYRSEHARRLAPDGSGVGLYAARGMVEAMGGTVAIQSALGAGTAITVTLPAEQADADVGEPTPAS